MPTETSCSFPQYAEEQLEELEWQRRAPYIEATSYLVKDDGSSFLDAVGKEVVFVKEGYFEQCKAIKQPQVDPRWTSLGVRRWQSSFLSESMLVRQRDGIGYNKLDMIERCRVIGISYHRRLLPEKSKAAESQPEGEDANGTWDPPAESGQEARGATPEAESLPPTADNSQLSDSSNEESSTDDDDDDDEEEEDLGRFFVRVSLQRLPQKNDRLGPVCAVIDHYVDSGVGEWLIPRERYDRTMSRRWQRGDRIQMYWADQASSGRGQWWEGRVVGYVKRKPEHEFVDSPWASVTIKWSETGSKDNISPWELSPPEDEFRDTSSGSEVESDWEAAGANDASEDEDWEVSEGRHGPGGSRSRKRPRGDSPHSDDSTNSLDFEPSRKRSKSSKEDLPETMMPRKIKGTVDWNKGHCAVCMARPDGSLVVECDGTCLRSFHARCLPEDVRPNEEDENETRWFCADCRAGVASCACCSEKGTAGQDVIKCKLGGCGHYFHPDCLRKLAAANACLKIHKDSGEASSSNGKSQLHFTCPSHYCDRCHLSGDSLKIFRCWTCLKAVHGKCMDKSEAKLNEKEMECRDCAAKLRPPSPTKELPRAPTPPTLPAPALAAPALPPPPLFRPAPPPSAPALPVPAAPPPSAPALPAPAAPAPSASALLAPAARQSSRSDVDEDGEDEEEEDEAPQVAAIPVWQPGRTAAPAQPKITRWTASITDTEADTKRDLIGKLIFHFGSHKKGGGCDFFIPVPNVKFHSELKIQPDGNVILDYCHNKAKELAQIKVTSGPNRSRMLKGAEQLNDGETITIAGAVFKFHLRPWDSSDEPILLI